MDETERLRLIVPEMASETEKSLAELCKRQQEQIAEYADFAFKAGQNAGEQANRIKELEAELNRQQKMWEVAKNRVETLKVYLKQIGLALSQKED